MSPKQKAVLDLLSGCPSGLTGHMLKLSGHAATTLRTLVSHGYLTATVETMTVPEGMTRTRYRITATGRQAITLVYASRRRRAHKDANHDQDD